MLHFSDNLKRVFSKPENDFEGFKKLFFDYTNNVDIYDEDGAVVPRAKVNEKINSVCFDILQLDPASKPTKREIKRAMKKFGLELFEVLEEAIDMKVTTGLENSEFFNQFVETKNIAQGDRNEFWTDKDVILTVSKVSGGHHDLSLQKLAEGEAFSVKTSNYGIKVGMDIDVYLTGRKDWSKFVDAVATAYQEKIQNDILAAVMGVGSELPVQDIFHKTIAISAATKDTIDQLIEDVSMANGNCDVAIFGLKTDLKKFNALSDVDWATPEQKEQYAAMGRLGSYESTDLIEIPNAFVKNDVTQKLIQAGTLLIVPKVENKFAKFVDVGETEIVEVTEKGQRADDFMTYEVQREMGINCIFDRYFGCITIA